MKELLFSIVLLTGGLSLNAFSTVQDFGAYATNVEEVVLDFNDPCTVKGKKKVKVLGLTIAATIVECTASNCQLAKECLEMMLEE